MTFPGPSNDPSAYGHGRRRLPYHSEEDMLELEARAGIHVGMLPSARGGELDAVDGLTGLAYSTEGAKRGWTAQQPFEHVEVYVSHACIMCGGEVDPDFLRDHRCAVAIELAAHH